MPQETSLNDSKMASHPGVCRSCKTGAVLPDWKLGAYCLERKVQTLRS